MKTTSTMNVTDMIRERLAALEPTTLTVIDDSALHAGHAGAQGGAGHYSVRIVSSRFEGLGRLARHRLVYHPVESWMPDRVHALSITAVTPSEVSGSSPQASSAP